MTTNNNEARVIVIMRTVSGILLAVCYMLMLFSLTDLIELSDNIVRLTGVLNLVCTPVFIFTTIRTIVLKNRRNA